MRRTLLLMYSNHEPTEGHLERLSSAATSRLAVVAARTENEALAAAPGAEIIFGHRYLRQCLPLARNLRWVQTTGAGFDHLPAAEIRERAILLTRTTAPSRSIARHAYLLYLALQRRLHECIAQQARRLWDPSLATLPHARTALVLGFGAIGREIGRFLAADGIRVWAVKRSRTRSAERSCDRLFTDERWRAALGRVDACFLTLPLTDGTRGLFDAAAVAALPKHAVIVNVGRGATLDARAVRAALAAGRLGGAGLDVLDPQPPGGDDALWTTPNLIITPYIAARYPGRAAHIERFFERQLERYIENRPLKNIVCA